MADFWIISYKERIHEDNPPDEKPDTFDAWQTLAIDIDSVVTIKLSKNTHANLTMNWIEVDNGYTYHATILKKVTDEDVILDLKKIGLGGK